MFARRFAIAMLSLLLALPIAAQEAEAETAPEAVAGAGTTVLLLGLTAVATVGGITLLRENAKKKQ